ncbi:MAG TPA: amino acid adenylation domain-containing protein [Blastocatellia bacterium]|nr:amino acid adenylation domain-containing protein [Blastocatellia bacterium]
MQEVIEGFRLSPQQKHLWLLQQADMDRPYRARCAISIEGPLDKSGLRSTLESVVDRHESLRTAFPSLALVKIPLQAVTRCQICWGDDLNLRDLSREQQEAEVLRLYEESAGAPTNLQQGQLVSARLIELSASHHLLLLSMPALCIDSAGLGNLVRDLARFYPGGASEEDPDSLPLQYALASEWFNELLESEQARAGIEFWRGKDVSPAFTLKLPFERQRTAGGGFAPRTVSRKISRELALSLESLAARSGASTGALLLACWQVLLSRLTGQREVAVGVDFDGRTDQELSEAVGLLARCLPVSSVIDPASRVKNVAEQVERAMGEISEWQECFVWGGDGEEASETPFFPFCFGFEQRLSPQSSGGLRFSIQKQTVYYDRFRLKLHFVSGGEDVAEFHYDSSALDEEEVVRVANRFGALLESVARNPSATAGGLAILDDAERRQLLFEFNDSKPGPSTRALLHQLFEARAEAKPSNISVIFEGEGLTYGELNARANRLARHLIKSGAGRETIVAVCLERSLDLVTVLLAILKSGAAYLPMDPSYPRERLEYMLSDSGAPLAITQSHLSGMFTGKPIRTICLDDLPEAVSGEPGDNPLVEMSDENMAYLIYTSGSTGRPKGVMVPHRGISNLMGWMETVFPLTEQDRLLQKTPLSFDASAWELFAPLAAGAQLVLAQPGGHQDIGYLVRTIRGEKITVLQVVPSLLKVLLDEPGFKECESLRQIFCGGEALPAQVRNDVLTQTHFGLINVYGPTEASVNSTFHHFEPRDGESPVVIGRPVTNAAAYILDDSLAPVPVGVPGELYIGGPGLARGYLGRPDLTAERFIPDLFGGEPGARLYRTGDLARHLPDGNIDFLGRLDHQVKLRGFRIELEEIECVLGQAPGVREAVVIPREDKPGDTYLAAYVVPGREQSPSVGELRAFLKERLPDYMVPSAFVTMERLPLLSNGKLDRQALPAPEKVQAQNNEQAAPPASAIEEMMASIWGDLLGVEVASVHDNFFDLGGHSLLATQVISRVRESFKLELPMRVLFESPTVAAFSAQVDAAMKRSFGLQSHPVEPAPRDGELRLSFAQQRLWLLHQMAPLSPAYNITAAVLLTGRLKVAALEQALNEILRRHEVLRTTFATVEGHPVQVINPFEPLALHVTDLSGRDESERREEAHGLAAEEAALPFDLSRDLPIRVRLVRLKEDVHMIIATIHHIASDGWSMSIFTREVATLYEAFARGSASPLEDLPIQYADFAQWQRRRLDAEAMSDLLSYWRGQLADAPLQMELPTSKRRPAVQTYRGAHVNHVFPAPLAEQLRMLSRRQGSTLFMTLLAAFDVLLHHYTGKTDIIVGTDVANRNRAETEALIGFFINQLVLRADLAGDPTFEEVLARVREAALGAYAHQDLPFEKLVESLRPERDLSRTPLFQIKLVLQNAPVTEVVLDDLSLESVMVENQTAKFDLLLNLVDAGADLVCSLEYNTDIYTAEDVAGLLERFGRVLRGVTADPTQRLSALSGMLAQADREQQAPNKEEYQDALLQKLRRVKRRGVPQAQGGAEGGL